MDYAERRLTPAQKIELQQIMKKLPEITAALRLDPEEIPEIMRTARYLSEVPIEELLTPINHYAK